jgi:hypothetical protein
MKISFGGSDDAAAQSGGRRWLRAGLGLTLGLLAPTYFIGRVFSLGWLNTAINRRVWCSDATSAERVDIIASSTASGVRYNTVVHCRRGVETVRTLGQVRLDVTGWTLAFVASLLLVALFVASLWGWSTLRRRS